MKIDCRGPVLKLICSYPDEVIVNSLAKATKKRHHDFLNKKVKIPTDHVNCILIYDRVTNQLTKCIKRHWDILEDLEGFEEGIQISFKRSKNPRDILVRSEFKDTTPSLIPSILHGFPATSRTKSMWALCLLQ